MPRSCIERVLKRLLKAQQRFVIKAATCKRLSSTVATKRLRYPGTSFRSIVNRVMTAHPCVMLILSSLEHRCMAISASEHAFVERLGACIAELRKQQDITQVDRAKALGVSQQAINSYEVGRRPTPVSTLARTLGVSLEELLGEAFASAAKRRGRAPKLQQQMERIQHLSRAQQCFIVQVIDTALAQQDPLKGAA